MRNRLRQLGGRLTRHLANETSRRQIKFLRKQVITRTQYSAIALLVQRYGYDAMSGAELRVFSQNGEDGVLAEIFSRIGTTNRFFVEFGVQTGVECDTRFLMEVLGWSGVYYEPDPKAFVGLSTRLANRHDIRTVRAFLTPANVEDFFSQADVPREPDLVSIDIDGQDYWIWDALETYRPRVIVIEYNSSLPSEARLVERVGTDHQGTFTSHFGASVGALRALGERKGYTLVHAELAGVNLFFVRDDLVEPFEEPLMRGPNFRLNGEQHTAGAGDYIEV